ncbi:hypothetical protein MKW98_003252 [Papaver atlanticum]|uniref:Uncharacterized protein n=1 Tax=Papaver atlanticum TaxID=357466 RepID=A0AAD4T8C3_9MAGN|nr:hypothetical protein MKW98_003252 [Papaver atlanticum]
MKLTGRVFRKLPVYVLLVGENLLTERLPQSAGMFRLYSANATKAILALTQIFVICTTIISLKCELDSVIRNLVSRNHVELLSNRNTGTGALFKLWDVEDTRTTSAAEALAANWRLNLGKAIEEKICPLLCNCFYQACKLKLKLKLKLIRNAIYSQKHQS